MNYAKMLITKDDFQFHRLIAQMPGSPQPFEMPVERSHSTGDKLSEEMEKWHKVGAETITVPAGTFLCDRWSKDDGKGEVWVSSKVSPMGMVRQVSENSMLFRQQMMDKMKKKDDQ
jgi:hypothetical protein